MASTKRIRVEIGNQSSYQYRDLFRLTGSVALVVAVPTLFFTAWSAIWTTLYMQLNIRQLAISPQLITILGVTLGLLLVFRTNTAYDRYWEGRRTWGAVITQSRNLARLFWVSVVSKGDNPLKDLEEKKGAINLIIALLYATKHYLRAEVGFDYPDVMPYIGHLADFNDPDNPPDVRHLPIYILTHLAAYVTKMRAAEKLDVGTQGQCMTALSGLTDALSSLERIRSSPIPMAYTIHLKHCLFIYLLAIPFQVVNGMYYFTIPTVGIAAFTLLGIESIGAEIENPFGLDVNDLPIEDFCNSLKDEMVRMMRRKAIFDPTDWAAPHQDTTLDYEELRHHLVIREVDDVLKKSQAGLNVSVQELSNAIGKIEAEKASIYRKGRNTFPLTTLPAIQPPQQQAAATLAESDLGTAATMNDSSTTSTGDSAMPGTPTDGSFGRSASNLVGVTSCQAVDK
ncbi:hypothetical protein SeLEV6574_g00386 [Synchytrium endobioticum]|nr:hypothetical protein SeLEV6574_g00386 [Synchytrium endobioticum]